MSLILNWYEACYIRQGLNDEQKRKFMNLRSGALGEQMLYKCLAQHISASQVLTDLWFRLDEQVTQIDAIVVSQEHIYVIEAKNYHRDHEYRNGQWWSAGQLLTYNPFSQLTRSIKILQRLIGYKKITGILAYMSQDSQCNTDGSNQYQIMSQADIINWTLQISSPNTNDHQLIQALRQASISELSTGFLYQLAPDRPLKTGIYCQACQSFELNKCYQSFLCPCGCRESKADLTKRMLVDYALIHYQQPINMKYFKHFTNEALSNYNIQSALKKYPRLHRGCYVNPYAAHYPKTPSLSHYS